jgi:excisionase family DNA binding protein
LITSTALSLGKAARLAGVGKTTLSRAIRSGRLGATRTATGYLIEPCELERAGYRLGVSGETHAPDAATGPAGHQATGEGDALATDIQIAALRDMLAVLRGEVADLREQRDRWQAMAERLSLAPPQPSPKPAMTWWRWLRTTG